MKKNLIIVSVIIFSLVMGRLLMSKHTDMVRKKQLQMMSTPTVQLNEIEEREVFQSIEIPGRVQSMDKVDLVSRVDGYLQKKHFKEGDFVRKNQVLLTIEQTQYLNNLNQAKAELDNAQAVLYKAKRDYQRGDELVKKDFISKSTYDGLYADKLAAEAAVKSASARLAEARRNYGYTQIKSPVDGKIGSLLVQEGNYVTTTSGTLATVVKTNPIYVKYSVNSKQFDELRSMDFIPTKGGKPIKTDVILSNGKVYPIQGEQDFWDNQISNTTGTMDFRATFKNDDNILIPGDFVKVKVYSNKINDELVVPQEFVLQDSKGKYVYIVDKDNTAQVKYFKDKGQYENYWIIESGLEKGEKYISTNLTKIMPKMAVKINDPKQASER